MKSDLELTIEASKKLESLLERNYGASGRGLHSKTDSVAHLLSERCIGQLRYVATLRNQIVHEEQVTELECRHRFTEVVEELTGVLSTPPSRSRNHVTAQAEPARGGLRGIVGFGLGLTAGVVAALLLSSEDESSLASEAGRRADVVENDFHRPVAQPAGGSRVVDAQTSEVRLQEFREKIGEMKDGLEKAKAEYANLSSIQRELTSQPLLRAVLAPDGLTNEFEAYEYTLELDEKLGEFGDQISNFESACGSIDDELSAGAEGLVRVDPSRLHGANRIISGMNELRERISAFVFTTEDLKWSMVARLVPREQESRLKRLAQPELESRLSQSTEILAYREARWEQVVGRLKARRRQKRRS